jgi:hypothetical protein
MYSSGPATNGLVPMGQSDGGFLSGIPWWAYVIVILIGLGLSIFCFVQYSAARRRAAMMMPLPGSPPPLPGAPPPLPGAPPPLAGSPPPLAGPPPSGAGNGFLIGGIMSALLLVVAPLVVMLIMQPWGGNWIVGRWSAHPGCVGESVEFTSGGTLLADGHSRAYRLDGDQLTVDGRTQTVRREGDRFSVDNETFYRCSGSEAATATGTSSPLTQAPAPAPSYATPTQRAHIPSDMGAAPSTPVPSYASWMIGRWSDSDCSRSMEFRADGTATTANGQPATFTVSPNGQGVLLRMQSGSQSIAGYLDRNGDSGATLLAYQPSQQTLNLRRCY